VRQAFSYGDDDHVFTVRPDTIDTRVVNEVFVGDEYGIGPLIRAGDVVLDVGAHIGSFTARATLKNDVRVFSVEPAFFNLPLLLANIPRGRKITVFNNALGGADGLPVIVRDTRGENTGGNECHGASPSEIPVHTLRLVTLAKMCGVSAFDIVKLDCEGGEHALFDDAASASLLARSRYVAMEVHGRADRGIAWAREHFRYVDVSWYSPDVALVKAHNPRD
jgi:FkbM family methyltransferase